MSQQPKLYRFGNALVSFRDVTDDKGQPRVKFTANRQTADKRERHRYPPLPRGWRRLLGGHVRAMATGLPAQNVPGRPA